MRPTPVGDLTYVRATHRSPYGLIASHWRIERDPAARETRQPDQAGDSHTALRFSTFYWDVTVPPNTTATLHIPTGPLKMITEGGKPAVTAAGLRHLGTDARGALFEAVPGRYSFASR